MRKIQTRFLVVLLTVMLCAPLTAQRPFSGAPEIGSALDRLNVTASALMIAAHPDDENTALLAWFVRGRGARTAYLSITRGEGGQNLIGPEQGDMLGLLRTQELLAARRIDGAQQLFTRAIDFGFSKTADETMAKWGRERVLADLVWNIRRFRPDVVVLRFSGTQRDGHGHHVASAVLGREAFSAAADPRRFPEQLQWVQPWKAKRLVWNAFTFTRDQERESAALAGRIEVDTGAFDPVLGYSYGEIAGLSRSLHRSQGFGAPERRGTLKNYLVHVDGEPAQKDIFDGIDASWNRVPGAAPAAVALAEAAARFDPRHPERTIPALLRARDVLSKLQDPIVEQKRRDLDDALALCAGLWLDASAIRDSAVPGGRAEVEITAINRSRYPLALLGVSLSGVPGAPEFDAAGKQLEYNQPVRHTLTAAIPEATPFSQPFWLQKPHSEYSYQVDDQRLIGLPEAPPALLARFRIRFDLQELEFTRPVLHRYVDRVYGELTRPFVIVPALALELPKTALLFPSPQPRKVEVQARAGVAGARGQVRLEAPAGWKVSPLSVSFEMDKPDEQRTLVFEVTPPAKAARGPLKAIAQVDGRETAVSMEVLAYPHIPPQTVFPASSVTAVRAGVSIAARDIGYVMGAGDEIPETLRQLGVAVTLLAEDQLARGDLDRFDAIVTGVRAFNTRADLRANRKRLFEYVERGGTLVVQYNVLDGGFLAGDPRATDGVGPYPIRVGRDRVTVEEAPVSFLQPGHPLMQSPNALTAADFDGWVQERGLYFANQWNPRYTPLFGLHDPGENPLSGATLFTPYGKGAYVFTSFSWFRQLPAGVPGAYRIFANLLSAGKTLR